MNDEIRAAGTIIAVRPGPRRIEVLVLRRSSRHRFLPGFVVFPGGAVEAADTERAEHWFGDASHAARACAVRELDEEAGLTSTAAGLIPALAGPGVGPEAVEDFPGGPPSVEDLPEVCHWVAPEDAPARFDARFFVVAAPRDLEPVPDGAEAIQAWWARPADLLEAGNSGGCTLYWPTMKVLEGLATCCSVEEALAAHIPPDEPEVQII